VPAQNAGPERALRIQVGRVEHDHLTHYVHNAHATGISEPFPTSRAGWAVGLTDG
jgi:hypothetical protein